MTSVQTPGRSIHDGHTEAPIKFLDAPSPRVDDGPSSRDDNRTIHAIRLFDFAGVFAERFQATTYGRPRARRLRLTDPDSHSTAGGKLARRSILLAPDDGARDVLVIGWVDVAQKKAEVRTFESLGQYFYERFGRRVDLSNEDYAEVHLDLAQFLQGQGIHLSLLGCTAPAVSAPTVESPSPAAVNNSPLFWMLGLATGFALGYACFGA